MRRHKIENVPEPFRTGMEMSNLWREEEETGGLAITNCLTVYLPIKRNEDALFVGRVGYDDGFNICDLLGLGDPEEKAAKVQQKKLEIETLNHE